VKVHRYMHFPERWTAKLPTRRWGVLCAGDRVRSYATEASARAALERHGGTLLKLWFDGCKKITHTKIVKKKNKNGRRVGTGRVRSGFLTQWTATR
jgi:hypothetical protein